jgi:hypothetical protein
MNTISNASTTELREAARGRGPVAECARRELARREEASERLAAICREAEAERNNRS